MRLLRRWRWRGGRGQSGEAAVTKLGRCAFGANFVLLASVSIGFACTHFEPGRDCRNDTACHSRGEVCVAGLCQECRTDQECLSGHQCTRGRCVSLPRPQLPRCSVQSLREDSKYWLRLSDGGTRECLPDPVIDWGDFPTQNENTDSKH